MSDTDYHSSSSNSSSASSASSASSTSSSTCSSASSGFSYVKDGTDVINMYKVCAVLFAGGRMSSTGTGKIQHKHSRIVSIYDGRTEYNRHQANTCSSDSPGFFLCKSKADALRTAFPRGSKLLQSQRCLIRCRVNIKDIKQRGSANNVAFTTNRLRPVEYFDIDKVYPSKNSVLPPHWEIVHWRPSGWFK